MIEIVEPDGLPAPEPFIDTDTEEYFRAAAEGRLSIGRCGACGEAVWYPRPICPHCHAFAVSLEEVSGRGRIYTFAVIRRGSGPYAGIVPYTLAYVELEEGPRVMTNIVDCDPTGLEIGQPVKAVFHRTPGGQALLRFRPS